MRLRFMRKLVLLSVILTGTLPAQLPRLRVSEDHHYLETETGKPFFYLGDTAWEIFHRLTREEVVQYLDRRAAQGFTAIQAVAIAEFDGLTEPNAYGALPLLQKDPTHPAVTPGASLSRKGEYDYWDHVDYVVAEANRRGIYVGLLPAWARYVNNPYPQDEQIFNPANAAIYGEFLGKRYRNKGVIWILGGDRSGDGVQDIWRAMARGIAIGANGSEDYRGLLMSFHPRGGATSSTWFHQDAWLSFNMQQTGHGKAEDVLPWAKIARDYFLPPAKPVIDGESLYEDHPIAFHSKDNGYSNDTNVRQRAYWDLFSGACGHTYGNHAMWQFYAPGRKPVNGPLMFWQSAIVRPGAEQMKYIRRLIESRPIAGRVPDQSVLAFHEVVGGDHIAATRGDGFLFVYSGQGRRFNVQFGKISGTRLQAYWFNPRSGDVLTIGQFENRGTREFIPFSEGFGSDWVLVLDDLSKNYPLPGSVRATN